MNWLILGGTFIGATLVAVIAQHLIPEPYVTPVMTVAGVLAGLLQPCREPPTEGLLRPEKQP